MTTTEARTNPARWTQAAVAGLLPPAYREAVLGDLQERFGERRGRTRWVGYIGDVLTTVPQVWWSQARRMAAGQATLAKAGDLRSRAERFQAEVWLRNACMFICLAIVIGFFLLNAQGAWKFHESVSLVMTVGLIGAIWQTYGVRGRSTMVPASLSWDELRTFHRRELMRQMGARHEFVYWSVPAVLLILYGLTAAIPGFRGGMMLLGAIALQNGAVTWAHRTERRRCQRELDWLDHEIEPT